MIIPNTVIRRKKRKHVPNHQPAPRLPETQHLQLFDFSAHPAHPLTTRETGHSQIQMFRLFHHPMIGDMSNYCIYTPSCLEAGAVNKHGSYNDHLIQLSPQLNANQSNKLYQWFPIAMLDYRRVIPPIPSIWIWFRIRGYPYSKWMMLRPNTTEIP